MKISVFWRKKVMENYCNKAFLFFAFLFLFSFFINAYDDNYIKESGEFFWGEGVNVSREKAYKDAMLDLMQSINVKVSIDFTDKIIEVNNDYSEESVSNVNSKSFLTLRGIEKNITTIGDKYKALLYISKDNIKQIISERKKVVSDIVKRAEKYENEQNYAFALKWYYFGLILLNSLPYENYYYQNVDLFSVVNDRINKILINTSFSVKSDKIYNMDERKIILIPEVFGKKAVFLDFTYWDGEKNITTQAKNGEAEIFLYGGALDFKSLKLYLKYNYAEAKNELNLLNEIWDFVEKPIFKNKIDLKLGKMPKKEKAQELKLNIQNKGNFSDEYVQKVSSNIYNFLENKNISTELRQKKDSIFQYNKLVLFSKICDGDLNKINNEAEFRQMNFSVNYKSLNKRTKESLVYDFDEEGNLYDVNFAIMNDFYEKARYQADFGKDWKEREKIVKFIEQYRTAFMTHDMELINKIFDDNAIIIIGKKIRAVNEPQKYSFADNENIYEYIKLKKDEYLERQAKVFENQGDILLEFSSLSILRKNNLEGVYGVSLRQNYNSTNYSDEGHLFLLVDFNSDEPKIYIRAWQPQEWDDEKIIKLSNFKVND